MRRSRECNGVSEDAPTFLKTRYGEIVKQRKPNTGIHIQAKLKFGVSSDSPPLFQLPNVLVSTRQSNLSPPRSKSIEPFLPHQGTIHSKDQDFDSVKFSVKKDVILGIKDKVRYQSVFHQNFLQRIYQRKGFYKSKGEITGNNKIPKIERKGKSDLSILQSSKLVQTAISRYSSRQSRFTSTKHSSVDPDNSLMRDYESDFSLARTPFSTRYGKLNPKSLSRCEANLPKLAEKLEQLEQSISIEDFEQRLTHYPSPKKRNLHEYYKTAEPLQKNDA
ncbi:unnamed protein product [Blepharisma stoltei]|uniref:Uncharacterized protein n=1 Tax=Blepharisma stoltei TaxID=1481888 RepID=A0AAU9JIA1_9CILI|nr:unnamed protein product [Blepharisma stoltei]